MKSITAMSIIDWPTSWLDRRRATDRFKGNVPGGAQSAQSRGNSRLALAVTRPQEVAHRQRVRRDIRRKQNGNSVQRHLYLW